MVYFQVLVLEDGNCDNSIISYHGDREYTIGFVGCGCLAFFVVIFRIQAENRGRKGEIQVRVGEGISCFSCVGMRGS